MADLGTWNVSLTLTDSFGNSGVFSFLAIIDNIPPAYVDPTVSYPTITLLLFEIKDVTIFPYYDPEGGSVVVSINDPAAVPVTFLLASDSSKVTFSPTSNTEVGTHTVSVILKD